MISNGDWIPAGDLILDGRAKNRPRGSRILVPILCFLIMVGAILGIAAYSYRHNRRDALALSDKLMKALDRRIAAEVEGYLAPMSDMLHLAAGFLRDRNAGIAATDLLEPLGIQILSSFPQIVAFSIGDPAGNFLMTKKAADGAVDTKIIDQKTTGRDVSWVRRNPAGDIIAREPVLDDVYDPRVRPWYLGAQKSTGLSWTEVYIFFTDQKPGITASLALRDPENHLVSVISLDVLLEELSVFLKNLQIGKSGRALIIDNRGYLIAFPEMDRMIRRSGDGLVPVKIEELGDAVLTRAYNRFRIEGHGTRSLTVDGRRYISAASTLPVSRNRHWSIMIVVPETDFIGYVRQNLHSVLVMSTGIVSLTAVLAGLLIWQGIRADRSARLVLQNRRQFERQGEAFSELAGEAVLFDPENTDAVAHMTKVVARAVDTRRTSVWRLVPSGDELICEDAYDRESDGHTQGNVLKRYDFSELFGALIAGEEIAVGRSEQDPRTAEFHRVYLHPLACSALMLMPVRLKGKTVGALLFADSGIGRAWSSQELTFGRAVAGMIALRFAALEDQRTDECEPCFPHSPESATVEQTIMEPSEGRPLAGAAVALGSSGRTNTLYDRLSARGLPKDRIGAEVFPDVIVLVLRFTDPLTLAGKLENVSTGGTMDYLIRQMEALAQTHGIDYLKIMSGEIVGATGFGDTFPSPAAVMADMALAVQEKCRHLFADLDKSMDFHIGLDMGPVIGSIVGEQQNFYNLWGDAVRIASQMAKTCVAGGIHVTESIYRPLRSTYVFQTRGSYYLEETGEIQTYQLTGRL